MGDHHYGAVDDLPELPFVHFFLPLPLPPRPLFGLAGLNGCIGAGGGLFGMIFLLIERTAAKEN